MKRKLFYAGLTLIMLLLVGISPLTNSRVAVAGAQSERCKQCLTDARMLHQKCMSTCDEIYGTGDTFPRLRCRNECRARPESNEYSYCMRLGACK